MGIFVTGLGSFLYIISWVSFHWRKRTPGELLMRSEKWLFSTFSPKQGWWPIIFLHNLILLHLLFVLENFKKKICQKKKLQGKKYSQPSLVDTKLSPRDHAREEYLLSVPFHVVCRCHKTNIKLFLLNHTIHLFCCFKNYVKSVPPVPAKRRVNR